MSNPLGQLDPLDPTTAASDALAEADAQTQASQRARRARRIKLSIISSLLIRPLAVLIPIVTIPLFLNYLGAERYGLYETIGALALYLGLTNIGLTMGLVNQLTECDVRDDRESARRYTSTLTNTMVAFTVLGVLLVTVITIAVDWQVIFTTTQPLAQRETPWAFWTAGVCIMLGMLSGIPSAIYIAYQENHRNNVWDGISRILSLAACFAVVQTDWGVPGVIIALTGVPTLVRLINLAYLFTVEKPWLRPALSEFHLNLLKILATHGVLLFLLQMSNVMLFQSDKLIIGIILTPADVTAYAIVTRIFLAAYGLFMMLLVPLWPASGEAIRRGDVAWVARTVRWGTLLGCAMIAACGIAMLIGGNWLLGMLPGGAGLSVSRWLIVAVTLGFLARAFVDARSTVLNSANVLVPQLVFYGGHAILNIPLAIALGRIYGVEGVAWANPITAALTSTWGYWWLMRRYIHSRPQQGATQGFPVVAGSSEKS